MDSAEPNLIRFNLDQRRLDNAGIEQLLRDIVSSVKELERKNEQLQKRNEELQGELRHAHERLARFEQPGAADAELARQALKMAAQLLANAEESASSHIQAAKAQSADDYEEAARRALELQRESVLLLEKTREEGLRRQREADRKAQRTLVQARESILSMAEELDNLVSGSDLPPLRFPRKPKAEETVGPRTFVEPETAPAVDAVLEETAAQRETEREATPTEEKSAISQVSIQAETGGNGSTAPVQPEPDVAPDLATTIELTASPFGSLADLVEFQRAIRRLPGVVDVSARAFDKDRLRLAIRYSSALPLANRLMTLPQYNLQPVSMATNRIEVCLAPGRP